MNIELPKDAKGREIPLDTETLYDNHGVKFSVKNFKYFKVPSSQDGFWSIEGVFEDETYLSHLFPQFTYLIQPDSWEKLLEDIERIGTDDCTWFCGYANENCSTIKDACIDSCKFFKGDKITCRKKLADDIVSRIRKLRGED